MEALYNIGVLDFMSECVLLIMFLGHLSQSSSQPAQLLNMGADLGGGRATSLL